MPRDNVSEGGKATPNVTGSRNSVRYCSGRLGKKQGHKMLQVPGRTLEILPAPEMAPGASLG